MRGDGFALLRSARHGEGLAPRSAAMARRGITALRKATDERSNVTAGRGIAMCCDGNAAHGGGIDTQRTERQRKATTEGGLMAQLSRLAKGLRRAYAMSGAPTVADFAAAAGVSYSWLIENMRKEDEPLWLRTLRAIKRATGLTWDEILVR